MKKPLKVVLHFVICLFLLAIFFIAIRVYQFNYNKKDTNTDYLKMTEMKTFWVWVSALVSVVIISVLIFSFKTHEYRLQAKLEQAKEANYIAAGQKHMMQGTLIVDIKAKEYKYLTDWSNPDTIEESGDYEIFRKYASGVQINDDEKENIYSLLSLENIERTLRTTNIFKFSSHINKEQETWNQVSIICVERDESNNPLKALITKNNVTESIKEEEHKNKIIKINSQVAEGLSKEYTSVFMVDYEKRTIELFNTTGDDPVVVNGTDTPFTEAIDKYINLYVHVDDKERMRRELSEDNIMSHLSDGNYFISYKRVYNNKLEYCVFNFSLIINEDNRKTIVVGLRNVNEDAQKEIRQKEMLEKILTEQIMFDVLTGIYNRDEFIARAKNYISNNESYILEFDIDKFSIYNEYFGNNEGDNLLRHIANSLVKIRENHYSKIIYARLANDHFGVVVNGDIKDVEMVVDLLKAMVESYTKYFDINLSIGAYMVTDCTISIEHMLDMARIAKKEIKSMYDKKYSLYNESMAMYRTEEQSVINKMNSALENKEFFIELQPKYNVFENKVCGAEALVRWKRDGETILPGHFIPIFEKNGFIAKLDMYVWEETLKYLKYRKENNLKRIPISVNVSRVFFQISNFTEQIIELVKKYDIEPELLELEITETLFMADIAKVTSAINKLRAYGFKVLMDDFGSGYSSLNSLKDIQVDILKIDLKFFENSNERSMKIVEAVINLAHSIGLLAIAEGVETIENVESLKKMGCKMAQGYYYSKSVSLDKFTKLCQEV